MSPDAFPAPHWGREEIPPLFKPVMAFAATPFGSRVIRGLVPLDQRVMKMTKGRYTLFGPTSMPEMLLTTIGRKSGQPRTAALSYLNDGDRLLVLGSNFGQSQHPAWSSNLLAHPEATALIGGQDIAILATRLTGADREQGLQRFLEYPMYRAYRTRTDRELRLFALTRR